MQSLPNTQARSLRQVETLEVLELEGRFAPSCITAPSVPENAAMQLDAAWANRKEVACPETK